MKVFCVMKRFMAFLIVFIVFTSSALADVASQVSAPERYRAEWTSNTGKLTLRIDAPVVVPDVETIYCVDTAARVFSPAEISAVGALLAPEVRIEPVYTLSYSSGRYDHWRYIMQANDTTVLAQYALIRNLIADVSIYAFSRTARAQNGVDAHSLPSAQRHAAQHSMSPEEALALADAAARTLDPTMKMTAWGVEEAVPASAAGTGKIDVQTEFSEFAEYYVFAYTPEIDGIPQLCTFTDCSNEDNLIFPFRCNRLYIAVDTQGVAAVTWNAPEAYGERHACALLPFERIIDVARQLLPLVQADTERRYADKGASVMIDRITLSYCRLQKRDAPGSYNLVPVWDFFGQYGYMENGAFVPITTKDEGPYNALLTLNATDGMAVDRSYGY